MRARSNYKSKRNVIIALIVAAVAIAAIAGSVAFIKGNASSRAAMQDENIVNTDNNNAQNNPNNGDVNPEQTNDNENNGGETTENVTPIISDDNNQENNTQQENGNTAANTTSENNISGNNTSRNNQSTNGNNRGTSNSTRRNSGNVPSAEYTQTTVIPGGGDERLISEDEKIGWSPITVSARSAAAVEITGPVLESHKLSYINGDSINDEPIHSTVYKNDIITYVIQVVNHSEIDAKGINIYDVVPVGTELVEDSISNNGTISNGRISWKIDVPAKNENEPVKVSFKVKVLLEDTEGKDITVIDNQAIVNGEPTEETHNPTITAVKKVQVVANDGSLLDNQTVIPGTRLRYTIVLKNDTDYDGVTKVTDKIPNGTSIVNDTISEGGELKDGIITWEKVEVLANSETEVYFDVTVNNNTRETVKNIAKIGNNDKPPVPEIPEVPENPDEPVIPDDDTYTNEVRTPVFIASKTSVLDGETVRETNTVEYVINVTNVGNPEIEEENVAGTAKLNDKYWIQDTDKMTFTEGTMIVTDKDGKEISNTKVDEEFLKNIKVTLNAGQTATITYKATVNNIDKEIPEEGIVTDEIANNLYWAKSEKEDEPSRPANPNDETTLSNPENPDDPTKPTPDPEDPDEEVPIDTVIVNVEERYIKVEAEKKWIDDNNKYETRPEEITFRLFRGYDINDNQIEDLNTSKIGNEENNWKVEFTKLKESNAEGRKYVYLVKEDEVKNYTTTYSEDKLTVINKYTNPIVEASKKVEVVKVSEDGTVTTLDLAPNAIVEPGTRLRYTITLTNSTNVDGYVNIEDNVPEGTTLYKEENISSDGTFSNGKITWNKIKVPAATEETKVGTASVYFDVTVNKNQKETVTNFATVTIPTIPEEPETPVDPENPVNPDNPDNPVNPDDPTNPEEPQPTVITTNTVKTPVFIASKKSVSDYNSERKAPKLHETNEVTYVVTITNSANPDDELEKDLTGTARLEDKFWNQDLNKMTYKSGTLVINNADGSQVSSERKNEDFLSNIEVTLKPGQTATLTYVYTIKTMKNEDISTNTENGITYEWDEISNNLYWAEPEVGEPSRPVNTEDSSNYKNEDEEDPTPATPDPEDENKPGLIDTVIVHVEEEYINIPATKKWIDDSNKYGTRPENITFNLYRGYDVENQTSLNESKVLLGNSNEWKVTFEHFRKTDANGREYVYTVKENDVKNYVTTYSEDKLTVINKYTNPIVEASKKVEVVKVSEDGTVTTSDLAPNAIVEPGTRLRYTITLTNSTNVDGYVNIEDNVPSGTTLYKEENISNSGKYEDGTITWNKIKVPAATSTAAGKTSVYFEVTVNKNQKETVTNFATVKIPTIPETPVNPENPDDPTLPEEPQPTVITTNTVKTPVFVASKKSVKDYNSETKAPKLHETNEVTYVVTITNSANPADELEKDLTGTARLEDKFWNQDLNKMTYKSGTLVIKNADGRVVSTTSENENFLSNIEVTLKPGQTATLTYVYTIKTMKAEDINTETKNGIIYEWDEISNNLYWAEPEVGEPSRPVNTEDPSNYKNEDTQDPTPATPDPEDTNKPGLIDTVIVHVEEEYIDIEATKGWDDNSDEYGKQPDSVQFTLYRDGKTTGTTLTPSKANGWKVTFTHLRRTKADGTAYVYTIKEAKVPYYRDPADSYSIDANNKVTITNIYGPKFVATKTSEQDGRTLEETNVITYTVTVTNKGKTAGTTTVRDEYRNNDKSKVTFVPGSITIDGTATTKDESYFNNMTFTLNPGQTKTITYKYKIKVLDKANMTKVDNKYTTTITNDLFWGTNKDENPNDPDYPTNTPIDTVVVNVEKKFVSFTARKEWNDSSDANKQRPTKIAFILQELVNNTNWVDVSPRQEKILTVANKTASDANKWEVPFTDLPKYNSDGKVIVYGVREEGIVTENGTEVRKSFVKNYQASPSADHKTIINTYKQDITGKVTVTNVTQSTIPMDVVFVLDVSGSMYANSSGTNVYDSDSTSTTKTNRLSNMVRAVNEEIKTIMASNNKNRVGIEIFNSSAREILNLGTPVKDNKGNYITFKNTDIKLSTGSSSYTTIHVPSSAENYYASGTYTQSGVFRATKELFKTDSKTDYKVTIGTGASEQTVSRIPVLILLTDGDPTHYDTNTDDVKPVPPNTIYGTIHTDKNGNITSITRDQKSIGRVRYCRAEDYACTMKTIEKCKNWITSKYDRNCKLYTIGLDMHGSMAKALLNPTSTNINKMNSTDTSTSVTYNEVHNRADSGKPHSVCSVRITGDDLTYYQNSNSLKNRIEKLDKAYYWDANSKTYKSTTNANYLTGANYYVWQQSRLYNILNGITTTNNGAKNTYGASYKLTTNYTDKAFTTSMSTADMQRAFREAINLSSESVSNINLQQSNNRRIDLTNIDTAKEFKIKITAVDVNGNTISINKTFTSFTAALSDTTVKAYIKGSYYLDFSNLRSGTIEVTYGKQ